MCGGRKLWPATCDGHMSTELRKSRSLHKMLRATVSNKRRQLALFFSLKRQEYLYCTVARCEPCLLIETVHSISTANERGVFPI